MARVIPDAATWIADERPDGPQVLRHAWEGDLILHCEASHLNDLRRLMPRVEILNAGSRFQRWYDPTHWPNHAFPPTAVARRR